MDNFKFCNIFIVLVITIKCCVVNGLQGTTTVVTTTIIPIPESKSNKNVPTNVEIFNNINHEPHEKYSSKDFTEQIFLPLAPGHYHPEKTHESISAKLPPPKDSQIQPSKSVGKNHNILDFSSYVFPPLRKAFTPPQAAKLQASRLNIDPSDYFSEKLKREENTRDYIPKVFDNYFNTDFFKNQGRYSSYKNSDEDDDNDDDDDDDNDDDNDDDDDDRRPTHSNYEKDDDDDDNNNDDDDEDDDTEDDDSDSKENYQNDDEKSEENYTPPSTTTSTYPKYIQQPFIPTAPPAIVYTTWKPHANIVAEKLRQQRLEAQKSLGNQKPIIGKPHQEKINFYYPTKKPQFKIRKPVQAAYVEPINYADVDKLVQLYNPDGYNKLPKNQNYATYQFTHHHPSPVYQQKTNFNSQTPKSNRQQPMPTTASELNTSVNYDPIPTYEHKVPADPYPPGGKKSQDYSIDPVNHSGFNLLSGGYTPQAEHQLQSPVNKQPKPPSGYAPREEYKVQSTISQPPISGYLPRAEYQIFQTFKRKRDLVSNTEPLNTTYPLINGRYSSQYTDAFNDFGVQKYPPKTDGEQASSDHEYVTVENSQSTQDTQTSPAPPTDEIGPDGRKILKEIKYFQDFFTAQPKPHELEFGHICEDPLGWEERYEKKDLKDNRHQGKVRWGDKKGGYGEHYYDLNHIKKDENDGSKGDKTTNP